MLVATVLLPADAVALEDTLEELAEVEIEAQRIAAHSSEWPMPCLWISADDFDAVDAALAADSSVESVVESAAFTDQKYYHVEWTDTVNERVDAYVGGGGSVLTAEATTDGWRTQFRFVSRDQLNRCCGELSDSDHAFELLDLSEPDSSGTSIGGVTPAQREALVAAYEAGYYDVPRRVTTRELAAELDVSHQSLSERLRRGTENLIDRTIRVNAD